MNDYPTHPDDCDCEACDDRNGLIEYCPDAKPQSAPSDARIAHLVRTYTSRRTCRAVGSGERYVECVFLRIGSANAWLEVEIAACETAEAATQCQIDIAELIDARIEAMKYPAIADMLAKIIEAETPKPKE